MDITYNRDQEQDKAVFSTELHQLDSFEIVGQLIDVHLRETYRARIKVNGFGYIEEIERLVDIPNIDEAYIMPGFVDAHVHIESSMLMPSEFARIAVQHGVLATVCDPHEIANVLGVDGVYYFIENGKQSGFNFFFGAPSCVPATPIDSSGAIINSVDIQKMMQHPDIHFLGEMMNFPGVVQHNPEVMAKIAAAKAAGKPIDGHAPNLHGNDLKIYAATGISTDHECRDLAEAIEKLDLGMNILIREGSAAKNFDALHSLISSHTAKVMLCTDDTHPNDLREGYINKLVNRGLQLGHSLYDLLQVASINPIKHYHLDIGQLRVGDRADFIVTDSDLTVQQTYNKGHLCYNRKANLQNRVNLPHPSIECRNNFHAQAISIADLVVPAQASSFINVIEVLQNDLYTRHLKVPATIVDHCVEIDIANDILKVVVLNRYAPNKPPAVAFVRGFGFQSGALCSSIAHDSHNIIAVGASDAAIVAAINAVIECKGGLSLVNQNQTDILPLPVGGIVSDQNIDTIADRYQHIHNRAVHEMASKIDAPFMTLAFMALIVIPELKICDKGLFDVHQFQLTSLFN